MFSKYIRHTGPKCCDSAFATQAAKSWEVCFKPPAWLHQGTLQQRRWCRTALQSKTELPSTQSCNRFIFQFGSAVATTASWIQTYSSRRPVKFSIYTYSWGTILFIISLIRPVSSSQDKRVPLHPNNKLPIEGKTQTTSFAPKTLITKMQISAQQWEGKELTATPALL